MLRRSSPLRPDFGKTFFCSSSRSISRMNRVFRVHNGQRRTIRVQEHSHREIESLAYRYWEERGRPFGSPEVDWFRAETDLHQEPVLVGAAKAVGAAVGSVV